MKPHTKERRYLYRKRQLLINDTQFKQQQQQTNTCKALLNHWNFFFVVICFVFIHYIIIFIKIILFTNIYVKHACQLTFLFGINRHSLEK